MTVPQLVNRAGGTHSKTGGVRSMRAPNVNKLSYCDRPSILVPDTEDEYLDFYIYGGDLFSLVTILADIP